MTPADKIRAQLDACGLSQTAAAHALELDPRTLRRYCAGDKDYPIPLAVTYALEWLAYLKSTSTDPACSPPLPD